MTNALFTFSHGLGDAAQFCTVLNHLTAHDPLLVKDVVSLWGKHSLIEPFAHRSFAATSIDAATIRKHTSQQHYDHQHDIHWPENWTAYADAPSTKTTRCLREVFSLEYDPRYAARWTPQPRPDVDAYLSDKPRAVAIHYQANTSAHNKDIDHDTIRCLCRDLIEAGFTPIILDWDERSPLPDNHTIHCPDKQHPLWNGTGTGDGATLAELLHRCELVIGVDSGPLHVAAMLDVPTLGVWREHFPGQFIDPADNVTHLIPEDWHTKGIATHSDAATYFTTHYHHRTYRALSNALGPVVMEHLSVMDENSTHIKSCGHWVRRNNYEQDMTIVRDVYAEDCYRLELIRARVEQAHLIVDIGACIGAFAMKAHEMNPAAHIICVEACPENIPTLRKNVGRFATILEGACTYEPGELMLLNAVRDHCESTGGSIVIPAAQADTQQPWWNAGYAYAHDRRHIDTFTLETIRQLADADTIDLLKLDCEGSEYSILGNAKLDDIRFIVGEYHDPTRWFPFKDTHFADWDYGAMYDGHNGGLFHLRNPRHDP